MAEFWICDGSVQSGSPCIVVKNRQTTLGDPPDPGVHQDPRAGTDNWVYVKVGMNGIFKTATDKATLRLWVARVAPEFVWSQLASKKPDQTWSNVSGNNVVEIGTLSIAMMLPQSGKQSWYEIRWVAAKVPPAGGTFQPCLLAVLDDGRGGSASVALDDRFARRNISITTAK